MYKYLNSGAGGIGGLFVHSRHLNPGSGEVKALHGWWSNKAETRFKMPHHLEPDVGASSFKISNPSPWNAILNIASLEIFEEVTMKRLIEKQRLLTGYMELLLTKELKPYGVGIITPQNPNERGCQLSIKIPPNTLETTAKHLHSFGVVFDVRYPDVIRVAPVPLYNSYLDVLKFVKAMSSVLSRIAYAVVSQLQIHDQDVDDALIIVKSRKDREDYIHTEDVIKEIQKHGKEIAVILLMGVHYYTGQLMDIEAITKAAHNEGCIIGWDLAHAIGNVELKMHDWGADFGIWCTYKVSFTL
ncbi:hypothetical protein J437_LFUL008867 [Ladona fulva]|uniref:Aminotransferase class V domain-containing protein n=1 Tax=Ladona fulva TaxID=123851 RepID=A0A8K0KBI9_LADFU|nr:hypothetical protein J437_LFUL008867 [Ladona fulva]